MPSRILVVDDDPTVCELIQEVLAAAEMESFALTDSRQAATRITQERFDAIFLDVRMPPPDGIELTRQIRASGLNRRTPIVVITGEEDNAVLKRAFEAGASFFLFKPIDRQTNSALPGSQMRISRALAFAGFVASLAVLI